MLFSNIEVWKQHFAMLHFGGGSLKPTIIWTNRKEVATCLARSPDKYIFYIDYICYHGLGSWLDPSWTCPGPGLYGQEDSGKENKSEDNPPKPKPQIT